MLEEEMNLYLKTNYVECIVTHVLNMSCTSCLGSFY